MKSILKIFLYPPFFKHHLISFISNIECSIKFNKIHHRYQSCITFERYGEAATNYDLKGTVRRVTFGKHWFQLLLTTMSTRECTGQDAVPLDHLVVARPRKCIVARRKEKKTGLPQWRSLTFHTRTIEITIFKALYVQHTSALKRIPVTRWSLCLLDPRAESNTTRHKSFTIARCRSSVMKSDVPPLFYDFTEDPRFSNETSTSSQPSFTIIVLPSWIIFPFFPQLDR